MNQIEVARARLISCLVRLAEAGTGIGLVIYAHAVTLMNGSD